MRPAQPATAAIGLWLGPDILFFALAVVLAWRNFRAGRGDIRGASRLAAFVLGVEMLAWLCSAHHVAALEGELRLFVLGIMWAGFIAGPLWALYVALEPYVRRYWPQSIISWSRLLSGGVRDPLVGGHLLIAVAIGVSVASLNLVRGLLLAQYGSLLIILRLDSVLDARRMMGVLPWLLGAQTGVALGVFFQLFLFRVLLRRQWLAVAAVILLGAGLNLASDHPAISASFYAILSGIAVFLLIRFGVLSFVIAPVVTDTLIDFPLTTDFSTWYAGSTIFALAVVLALTAYAFHTAVAGRPLFKVGLLERD